MSRFPRTLLLVGLATLGLTACSGEDEELQSWMDQQRHEVQPSVKPLSPPQKFNPQAYTGLDGVEPFSEIGRAHV